MKQQELTIMVDEILSQMKKAGFSEGTCGLYRTAFNRLLKIAARKGETYYTEELGIEYMSDESHMIPENSERYWHEQTLKYKRCIRFIDMYRKNGHIDFSPNLNTRTFPLKSKNLDTLFSKFIQAMELRGLKDNTKNGYRRFVYYFLEFIESKNYKDLSDIQPGDIVAFITFICSERYQPTSLGAVVPGLKFFLEMQEETKRCLIELPLHLPKKREILQIYSDEEYKKIVETLDISENISLRNKAITILALDTGLRAVDICALKLSNIDWNHNCIHMIQQKTDHVHNIPLSETIGNALVDYLLNERPAIDSDYIFLRNKAPYTPLMTHTGIRNVLFHAINDADIECKGRIYGTRITRHSVASRMLRNGVPLYVISDALGHGNPNSVLIYLTADDAKLAECTLPLPKEVRNGSR